MNSQVAEYSVQRNYLDLLVDLPWEKFSEDNFDLSKYVGKNIILYFYPRDNTSGCTTEAIDFNKLLPVIKKNNGIVIGVSKDNLESHMKFKTKNKERTNNSRNN